MHIGIEFGIVDFKSDAAHFGLKRNLSVVVKSE